MVSGCARAKQDTTGFAIVDTITINAPFDDTWQATKAVLRELELDMYTRDKRGRFVAYTKMEREFYIATPRRTELEITLKPISGTSTEVSIKTLNQIYGVTLLTYPDWHSRETTDNQEAQAILDALQGKLS
ncbi:MAG: hypothetical protein AMXMBFR84_25410 [Candidatus Hydrogenedentota bacterium]